MAATVATAQAADISSATADAMSTSIGPPHPADTAPSATQDATEESTIAPLPPTRRFQPHDFSIVRTLGTGEFYTHHTLGYT